MTEHEAPRLDSDDIVRVLDLTAEICDLNESIRGLADAPAAQLELIARRRDLLAELVGERSRRSRRG